MRTMVLGCGPAGLMAAHGVIHAHAKMMDGSMELRIFSRPIKSKLFGAQYLHAPIPESTQFDPQLVRYQLRGHVDDYRRKVYGKLWDGTVSPEDLTHRHQAWDIRQTYNDLWGRLSRLIINADIDPIGFRRMVDEYKPDIIINSIPRSELCHMGHAFGATEIWAAGDAPELGIRLPYSCPPMSVICNGEDNPAWYRMSNVFGYTTVEWPGSLPTVPVNTAARVRKPTKHDCDCWSDFPMVHVGRYGRWEKGVLSHEAYMDARLAVESALSGGERAARQAGA